MLIRAIWVSYRSEVPKNHFIQTWSTKKWEMSSIFWTYSDKYGVYKKTTAQQLHSTMLKTTRTLFDVDSSGNTEPISEYNWELTVPSSNPKKKAETISRAELGVIIPVLYESVDVHYMKSEISDPTQLY